VKQLHGWYDRAREVLDKEGPPETSGEVTDGGPWHGIPSEEWLIRLQARLPQGLPRMIDGEIEGGLRCTQR
jgi:hypothetical protein